MRSALLVPALAVLAAACTHRAPEGAPTEAPPSAAETGTPLPPPDPARWSQRIKPILAGGVTQAKGLEDWPAERLLAPAAKVFDNVKLLGDDRADTFMAAMQSMKPSIGMGCKACHVKGDFASDEKGDKKQAREMIEMAAAINSQHFEDRVAVSCFTCHAGEDHPEHDLPADARRAEPKTPVPPLSPADAARPAEEVYANIKVFTGVKAGQLMQAMESFNAALGVGCEHCHAEGGDWKSESEPEKETTRKMLKMVGQIDQTHFEGKGEVSCWTCHRGNAEPLLRAEEG